MDESNNLNSDTYLEQRARRGDRTVFERAMAKVPDVAETLVDPAPASDQDEETRPS